MMRSTIPPFEEPRRKPEKESSARDVVLIFTLLLLAWATTSCAGAPMEDAACAQEASEVAPLADASRCLVPGGSDARAPATKLMELKTRERRSNLLRN